MCEIFSMKCIHQLSDFVFTCKKKFTNNIYFFFFRKNTSPSASSIPLLHESKVHHLTCCIFSNQCVVCSQQSELLPEQPHKIEVVKSHMVLSWGASCTSDSQQLWDRHVRELILYSQWILFLDYGKRKDC